MLRDLILLKSKLNNALIKRKRALENSNVDPYTGFTLEEVDQYIRVLCQEIVETQPEPTKNYLWVKELKINARSILNGRLERITAK